MTLLRLNVPKVKTQYNVQITNSIHTFIKRPILLGQSSAMNSCCIDITIDNEDTLYTLHLVIE